MYFSDSVCGCCFFFFKQKPAYELRISDWSSDVCSSDLSWYSLNQALHHDNPDCPLGKQIPPEDRRPGTGGRSVCIECARLNRLAEIGRVSCRERVCQYV